MKNVSWKLPLIILAIIVAVVFMFMFGLQGVPNKAISYEEQITTAQSEIKIQEKRRVDLIPNLVDCVKAYDEHEYQTLRDVISSRGVNSDADVNNIMTSVTAVAEAYPQLQSSSNYKELMNELATTENLIANVRSNYNTWVSKYNTHCKKFPNKNILNILGYEVTDYQKLNFNTSSDAPQNLFGD